MKLVVYIRGGLGDIWPAISAIKPIIDKYNISKFDTLVFTDSVYYFRPNYPKKLEEYSLDMLRKISNNIITIPPELNNNFNLTIDDTSNEFCQEEMDKHLDEFMFWRPPQLQSYIWQFLSPKTIFIDVLCTEGIFKWNFKSSKYERLDSCREKIEFIPSLVEKMFIDNLLKQNHIVIHIRVRDETNQLKFSKDYYNKIIKDCNDMNIIPILFGMDMIKLEGIYHDLREGNVKNHALSFEGMGYLMTQSKVLLGDGSGLTLIKQYDQNWNNLLIQNVARMRINWWDRAIKQNERFKVYDGSKDNTKEIISDIKEYYK